MRCIFSAIAGLGILGSCFGGAASAADEAFQNKTLRLRTGPITLEPTQSAPPQPKTTPSKANPPGQPTKPAPAPKGPPQGFRGSTLKSAQAPAATAGETKQPAAPRTVNKPIASERVIVNFERRVTEAERQALSRNGIEVGEFLGGTAYTAKIRHNNVEDLVRASQGVNKIEHVVALDERTAHIKVDPALSTRQPSADVPAPRASAPAGPIGVVVELWPDTDIDAAKSALEPFGRIVRVSPRTRKIEMSLPTYASVEAISKLKSVKFIAPTFAIKTQNTHVRRNIGIEIATAPPHSLSGKNVRVGVWDGGHVAANHPSFSNKLSDGAQREHVARHEERHATHVAGTIAGIGEFVHVQPAVASEGGTSRFEEGKLPGAGEVLAKRKTSPRPAAVPAPAAESPTVERPFYPGVAVGAHIVSYDFNGAAEELITLLTDQPGAIDVMNNSWGLWLVASSCSQLAAYNVLDAPEFDAVVSGQKDGQPIRRIPIVFSAGNTRNDGLEGLCGLSTDPGFPNFRTVTAPGTAKNVITVGAIDADNNAMTEFSSWGPTANGRLKPDIVAPGCRVLSDGELGIISMFPPNGVGRMCGTSMAAPAVTGVIALLIEKMELLGLAKTTVHPSTYKALLVHGAEDLGRPGPDFEFGYGRVQLGTTLKLMDDRAFHQLAVEREGEIQVRELTVAPGAREIKVTLVWDDRPTGVFADEALANDLDLVLVSPTGTQHLPFLLNAVPGKETEPARPGVDHLNVVEQVLVEQPAAGVWRIEVRASKIGSPIGGQTYSLVTSVR